MPTYVVSSGDMQETIETEHDADPMTLCVMAIVRSKPTALGFLLSVTGGKFVDENAMYVSAERVLEGMGLMPPNAHNKRHADRLPTENADEN